VEGIRSCKKSELRAPALSLAGTSRAIRGEALWEGCLRSEAQTREKPSLMASVERESWGLACLQESGNSTQKGREEEKKERKFLLQLGRHLKKYYLRIKTSGHSEPAQDA